MHTQTHKENLPVIINKYINSVEILHVTSSLNLLNLILNPQTLIYKCQSLKFVNFFSENNDRHGFITYF